ncbi:UDP-N-acetylmuramoyl-L-alanyl-D-glutamate--2,6-diaminopimelate ligase [Celerinatantimonas sp. YJH-8]|uniref:UDP-N-acetylmuramoyl-L-alanyl-D-glutamate--2, 6-diaminopimelate ligase n=1 Tax=Celerinatantimonas sp. YJH-8 TaxID=3228714 RepID=UPI0038C87EAD
MKAKLSQLMTDWFSADLAEDAQRIEIRSIVIDSRQVTSDALFVAIQGIASDGRRYIEAAIHAGASAVLAETEDEHEHGSLRWSQHVPVIYCYDLKDRLAQLARRYYVDLPRYIVGVTGTNGKSTTTHLIASLAQLSGIQSAVMGTLGNGRLGQLSGAINTTADIFTIYRQLHEFATQGIELVAMEVSSHGLAQGRVDGIPFSAAVFTNLTRDHLDYHGTMEAYGAAKARLFEMTRNRVQVINRDDPFGQQLLRQYAGAISYSLESDADWTAHLLALMPTGSEIEIHGPASTQTLQIPLLGRFNISNTLAAVSCLDGLALLTPSMLQLCQQLHNVPGRMELFTGNTQVVVDYAHTPDALAKALQGVREHCKGQLICIFGCGGDRDRGKRPLMAAAAEQNADWVIVTNDNPRTESPEAIVADILPGFNDLKAVRIQLDRQQALKDALSLAGETDMILLAGKGHEDYQIIGHEKRPYDERRIVQQLLEAQLC